MPRDQLELVQDLAERQEKEAGQRLSQAQSQLDAGQSQLDQVMLYRTDYYRLATGAAGGDLIDTNQLQTARHFYRSSTHWLDDNKKQWNKLKRYSSSSG